MKNSIENLSFEAFKRWYDNRTIHISTDYAEAHWPSLCAEAEKRDPVIQWAVVNSDNECLFIFDTKEGAELEMEERASEEEKWRVVKLQEVNT